MDTQKIITGTTATEPTAPSLAELLAARAEQIAEYQRENARREQESREQDSAEAMDYVSSWLRAHVSPALADALRIIPTVDESRLDEESDDYSGIALAGFLLLDVRGAGVDDSDDTGDTGEAQRDTGLTPRAERWTISREHRKYVGYHWRLRGPYGYDANLGELYQTDENIDSAILDAIAAYPAWLAGANERRAEEERKQLEKQRARERKTPPYYFAVQGGPKGGMLDRGNRVRVTAEDRTRTDGTVEVDATIEEATDTWLLLTVNGGFQRIIPVARVIEILPLGAEG